VALMSAYGIHPTFTDLDTYRTWLRTWRRLYGRLSAKLKGYHRLMATADDGSDARRALQSDAAATRIMATKLLAARETAKIRWLRILDMEAQLARQDASFPLDLGRCAVLDFHYNRGHGEFPILPMWTVKVKGQQLFLRHLDFEDVSFSTRELADGMTKGMLRFRHVHMSVDATGLAKITSKKAVDNKKGGP
jgi:hypothetical protein